MIAAQIPDLLDLIERDLVVRAIVELSGAQTLMRSHGLGIFERTAVVQICGYASRADSMVANLCWDAGVGRAALNHAPGIGLGHAAPGENLRAPDGGAEEGLSALAGETRALNIVLQITLEMMVAGHAILLAAFFVQPHPQTPVLPVNVFDIHAESRADAGKGKGQKSDQRMVAQADYGFGVDAVERLARVGHARHWGFADFYHVLGAGHRRISTVGLYEHPHQTSR